LTIKSQLPNPGISDPGVLEKAKIIAIRRIGGPQRYIRFFITHPFRAGPRLTSVLHNLHPETCLGENFETQGATATKLSVAPGMYVLKEICASSLSVRIKNGSV
jgi:hypothetical protein